MTSWRRTYKYCYYCRESWSCLAKNTPSTLLGLEVKWSTKWSGPRSEAGLRSCEWGPFGESSPIIYSSRWEKPGWRLTCIYFMMNRCQKHRLPISKSPSPFQMLRFFMLPALHDYIGTAHLCELEGITSPSLMNLDEHGKGSWSTRYTTSVPCSPHVTM